jgi:hypothetical protein
MSRRAAGRVTNSWPKRRERRSAARSQPHCHGPVSVANPAWEGNAGARSTRGARSGGRRRRVTATHPYTTHPCGSRASPPRTGRLAARTRDTRAVRRVGSGCYQGAFHAARRRPPPRFGLVVRPASCRRPSCRNGSPLTVLELPQISSAHVVLGSGTAACSSRAGAARSGRTRCVECGQRWRSRLGRSLQAETTDSIVCRLRARCGPRGGSVARGWRTTSAPDSATRSRTRGLPSP